MCIFRKLDQKYFSSTFSSSRLWKSNSRKAVKLGKKLRRSAKKLFYHKKIKNEVGKRVVEMYSISLKLENMG